MKPGNKGNFNFKSLLFVTKYLKFLNMTWGVFVVGHPSVEFLGNASVCYVTAVLWREYIFLSVVDSSRCLTWSPFLIPSLRGEKIETTPLLRAGDPFIFPEETTHNKLRDIT